MLDVTKQIQVGQTVRIGTASAWYEIMVVEPDPSAQVVVAVGPDYIVVSDESAAIKTRIPGHILKLVERFTEVLPQAA
jgi:hypothetical protein